MEFFPQNLKDLLRFYGIIFSGGFWNFWAWGKERLLVAIMEALILGLIFAPFIHTYRFGWDVGYWQMEIGVTYLYR
jgi:hypothetical protein